MSCGFGFLDKWQCFLYPPFLDQWSCYLTPIFLSFQSSCIFLCQYVFTYVISDKMYHPPKQTPTIAFHLPALALILRNTLLRVFKYNTVHITCWLMIDLEFLHKLLLIMLSFLVTSEGVSGVLEDYIFPDEVVHAWYHIFHFIDTLESISSIFD